MLQALDELLRALIAGFRMSCLRTQAGVRRGGVAWLIVSWSVHLHACMHAYIRNYIRTYIPTYLPAYLSTYIHTYIHTLQHTYVRTQVMYVCMYAIGDDARCVTGASCFGVLMMRTGGFYV